MVRIFTDEVLSKGTVFTVTGSEVRHMVRVLRMQKGALFEAVDGSGRLCSCRILEADKESVNAEVLLREEACGELSCAVTLYLGITKADKMELVMQKAVELGVSAVVPVETARTVVHLKADKAEGKRARWQAICEAAAMQSRRTAIPEVRGVMSFDEALREAAESDVFLFPYEEAEEIGRTKQVLADLRPGQRIAVFIGPEGGFEPSEADAAKNAGAHVITLGKRILRAETAAIAVMSILMFSLEQ